MQKKSFLIRDILKKLSDENDEKCKDEVNLFNLNEPNLMKNKCLVKQSKLNQIPKPIVDRQVVFGQNTNKFMYNWSTLTAAANAFLNVNNTFKPFDLINNKMQKTAFYLANHIQENDYPFNFLEKQENKRRIVEENNIYEEVNYEEELKKEIENEVDELIEIDEENNVNRNDDNEINRNKSENNDHENINYNHIEDEDEEEDNSEGNDEDESKEEDEDEEDSESSDLDNNHNNNHNHSFNHNHNHKEYIDKLQNTNNKGNLLNTPLECRSKKFTICRIGNSSTRFSPTCLLDEYNSSKIKIISNRKKIKTNLVIEENTIKHNNKKKKRKNRRNRTVFTELQLMGLERRFDSQKYLSTPDRAELANALGLSQLQVKTWYQNRRMKWKKQVMQDGCLIAPTKPKGRPKKNSIPSLGLLIDSTNHIPTLEVTKDEDERKDINMNRRDILTTSTQLISNTLNTNSSFSPITKSSQAYSSILNLVSKVPNYTNNFLNTINNNNKFNLNQLSNSSNDNNSQLLVNTFNNETLIKNDLITKFNFKSKKIKLLSF